MALIFTFVVVTKMSHTILDGFMNILSAIHVLAMPRTYLSFQFARCFAF